jgi:hypothetical protein
MKHALFAGAFAAALVGVSVRPPAPPEASGLRAMVQGVRCGPEAGLARRAALGELLIGASAYAQTLPGDMSAPPPLMRGLGDAHLEIATSEPRAQAYFDQGLRMLHNFNHAEAIRAFKEAQRLDPQCAMCFWGEAFATTIRPRSKPHAPPKRALNTPPRSNRR